MNQSIKKKNGYYYFVISVDFVAIRAVENVIVEINYLMIKLLILSYDGSM